MRGIYYNDVDRANGAPQGPYTGQAFESAEDRNARENTAKAAAGQGPQVIAGPDTVPFREDIAAIVQAVALRILESELDWSESDLREKHPALNGIPAEDIRQAIREGLK